MRLSDYLREDLVIHDLEAADMQGALTSFANLFQQGGHVASSWDIKEALQAREEAHTTCLGRGIAVPHATVPKLMKPLLLVARAKDPVPFGPPETEPADLFFVLLSPSGRGGEHIKLLARICRLAQHEEDLEDLRSAPDAPTLMEAILRIDARHV